MAEEITNDIVIEENEILVLLTRDPEKEQYDSFKWSTGVGNTVEVSDWNPEPVYDGGLHGLPWGEGSHLSLLSSYDALWILVAVNTTTDYIYGTGELTEECKFRSGKIVYVGNKKEAVEILQKMAPPKSRIVYLEQTGENDSIQIGGHKATQTAKDKSNQTAEDESIQNAGKKAVQIAGKESKQTAEDKSIQNAGKNSHQTSGNYSMQNAEEDAHQIAGNNSTQIAKDFSHQTAGNNSIQTSTIDSLQVAGNQAVQTTEDNSTQIAGDFSTQVCRSNSIQSAGDYSTQTTNNNTKQRAGIGTVQISKWLDGKNQRTSIRIVDEMSAYKEFFVKDGKWTEVIEENRE